MSDSLRYPPGQAISQDLPLACYYIFFLLEHESGAVVGNWNPRKKIFAHILSGSPFHGRQFPGESFKYLAGCI